MALAGSPEQIQNSSKVSEILSDERNFRTAVRAGENFAKIGRGMCVIFSPNQIEFVSPDEIVGADGVKRLKSEVNPSGRN